MRKTLATLLLCGSLAGAAPTSFTLSAGQATLVGGGSVLVLRTEDSRCPPQAFCFMAGTLKASLLVLKGFSARMVKLELGQTAPTPLGPLKLESAGREQRPRLTFRLE